MLVIATSGALPPAPTPYPPSLEAFGTWGLKGKNDLLSDLLKKKSVHSLRSYDIVTRAHTGSGAGSVKLLNLSLSFCIQKTGIITVAIHRASVRIHWEDSGKMFTWYLPPSEISNVRCFCYHLGTRLLFLQITQNCQLCRGDVSLTLSFSFWDAWWLQAEKWLLKWPSWVSRVVVGQLG